MDKLTMAHDWYMKHGKDNYMEQSIKLAFDYADAMQAEANKRGNILVKESACSHEPQGSISGLDKYICKKCNNIVDAKTNKYVEKEWQPDWSQAPEHANIWQKSSADNHYWYRGDTCLGVAPSFDYQGDWKNSLRKRP